MNYSLQFFLTNYQTSHRLFLRQTFYVFSLMNEDTCQNVGEDLYYFYGSVIAEIRNFWNTYCFRFIAYQSILV